jgi:FkbM family methyltransferase
MDLLKEFEGLEEKDDLLTELKKEKLPLVMWGAGQFAEEVSDYLKKNNILLDEIFVDDDYYIKGRVLDGKSIISYSMLKNRYKLVNIVSGNTNYEMMKKFEGMKLFNKIFCFFSISYGVYDKLSMRELEENIHEFECVYNLLEDDKSKHNLLAFLKTRVSGNNRYVLDVFDKNYNFFNNDVYRVGSEEVFLDVGAYDGDTIRLFLKENQKKYQYIYAIEPDAVNRSKLQSYVQENSLSNISITKVGAWKEKDEIPFMALNEQLSGISLGNEACERNKIKVNCLDKIFAYEEKITILKINYFDGVTEALEGARNLLKEHKPKLAITVGFDCRNIRYVPMLIKEINSEYKIYLRFNRGMVSALTCYGIVE